MKILLVGNCQARPVAELLSKFYNNVEIVDKIIVHLASDADMQGHMDLCADADIILAQQVVDNYPVKHVTTNYLKSEFPNKVITWVNVFFQGQNPDFYYVTGEDGKRLVGPADVYHSRALIDLWKSGKSANDVSESNYISDLYGPEELLKRIEKSLQDLKARESGVDIKMHDYIDSNWSIKPLFHTFNHPNVNTLVELCARISAHLGLVPSVAEIEAPVDHLSLIVPPFEQVMANKLGMQFDRSSDIHGLQVADDKLAVLPGKKTVYKFNEFVQVAFDCYTAQRENLVSVRYTPAY